MSRVFTIYIYIYTTSRVCVYVSCTHFVYKRMHMVKICTDTDRYVEVNLIFMYLYVQGIYNQD